MAVESTCSSSCWTPIRCIAHGRELPPRGRSVPPGSYLHNCDEADSATNARHLWDDHDADRSIRDPEGWEAHEASCEFCGDDDDDI